MKMKWSSAVWVLSVFAVLFVSGARGPAQPGPVGHARDFTSVEYYDAPLNQTQMKSRLSGAEAQPLPGVYISAVPVTTKPAALFWQFVFATPEQVTPGKITALPSGRTTSGPSS